VRLSYKNQWIEDKVHRGNLSAQDTVGLFCLSCLLHVLQQRARLTRMGSSAFSRQGCVGSCSQANYLLRNSAMDDSIGGS
jgi:hypothetical protein